jgi:hypothetical protein
MDFDVPGDYGDPGDEASTARTIDPESDLYSRGHPSVFVETEPGKQWVLQDFLPVDDEGMIIYMGWNSHACRGLEGVRLSICHFLLDKPGVFSSLRTLITTRGTKKNNNE